MRGGPYAEALTALVLLQRVSPSAEVAQAAERIASLITADRRGPPFPVPRTVEALTEYYKLKRSQRHREAVFSLAEKMARRQVVRTRHFDFAGGFARPDLPPDTATTAATMCALASAYEVARMTARPTERFSVPVTKAARFIMNMQYRPENSFFLARAGEIRGAFRSSPEDLRVRLAPNAEAIRALILAASITAATVPAELPESPKNKVPVPIDTTDKTR